MRRTELTRYRTLLEKQLAEAVHHGTATVQELSREGDEIPDPNDRASVEADRIQELRLRDRDRKLIAKIQEAISRIDEGTFGRCASCGHAIEPARLRARPVTTLCIDCKREAEAVERRGV